MWVSVVVANVYICHVRDHWRTLGERNGHPQWLNPANEGSGPTSSAQDEYWKTHEN